jgi:hypothetical protein
MRANATSKMQFGKHSMNTMELNTNATQRKHTLDNTAKNKGVCSTKNAYTEHEHEWHNTMKENQQPHMCSNAWTHLSRIVRTKYSNIHYSRSGNKPKQTYIPLRIIEAAFMLVLLFHKAVNKAAKCEFRK